MPRYLGVEENILNVRDSITGDVVQLRYRTPGIVDMQNYSRSIFQLKDGVVNVVEAMVDAGISILTGIREGDFFFENKPLSSDPDSPNFRENWKEIVRNGAPNIVALLATTIFDSTCIEPQKDIPSFSD